jgi:hypothetical protein
LIGARPGERALKQLWKMLFATINVPAHIIWVVLLKIHGAYDMLINDDITESGGKTLNLVNQALGGVPSIPIGCMCIGP